MGKLIHEALSKEIIGAAMTVLNELKPVLDEKLYERALVIELRERGRKVSRQTRFTVFFKEHDIGTENAAGICRCLQEKGLAGKVKVVATGDSEDVRNMMRAGAVQARVYQNQILQGRRAVGILAQFLENGDRPPPEVLIPPDVILRSNLDLLPSSMRGGDEQHT